MEESFNGWANRATWNVALWLQNDFTHDLEEIASGRNTIENAEKFRSFVIELFAEMLPDGYVTVTPDGFRLDEANWDELWNVLVVSVRNGKNGGVE